jgi:hypothetical protein
VERLGVLEGLLFLASSNKLIATSERETSGDRGETEGEGEGERGQHRLQRSVKSTAGNRDKGKL